METGKGETPSILFPIRQHGIHTIVVDCAALACRDDVIANRLKIHFDFFFFLCCLFVLHQVEARN